MYKVLIVDDEPLILQGLRDLIEWENMDLNIVGEANCGKDALDIITTQKVDILITDIRMSYMNGLELIAEIRKLELNTRIIVLSGYDDFNYIKQAIQFGIENYLLKPVSEDELISTLMTVVEKIETNLYQLDLLKSNFLLRWIHNTIGRDELFEKAKFLNVDLTYSSYAIILIKIIQSSSPEIMDTKSHTTNEFLVENILLEKFRDIGNPLIFKDFNGDYAVLISDFTKTQYEVINHKILPSCIRNITSFLHLNLFVTIGSIETNYQNVGKSYTTAKELLEYRLVSPLNVIVTHQDRFQAAETNKLLLNLDYTEFKNFIMLKNTEKINAWIDSTFVQINESKHLEPLMLQNLILEILFFTISTVKSIDSSIDVLNNYPDLYVNVLRLTTINDFKIWLKSMIMNIMDVLISSNKKAGSLMNSISVFIQENYSKNINLDTVASEFDKNSAYIGQLFKKEFGESFTNYINRFRIERAKELLRSNPELTTSDISFAVGYYNTNYFYTIFKKLTGETPSDYRAHIN